MKTRPRGPCRNNHPLVRELFDHLDVLPSTLEQIAVVSGVDREAYSRWRRGRQPTLASFEAAVGALGGRLRIEWENGDATPRD